MVKTLNHIGYHELETDGLPSGSEHRRGLGVAGNDDAAVAAVMDVIDQLGFDPVYAGPLQVGAAFQPGTAIFGGRHNADELQAELARFAHAPSLSGAERA